MAADALASLQGPLLIGSEQDAEAAGAVARRLDRLAEEFGCRRPARAPRAARDPGCRASPATRRSIEAPLAMLERLAAEPDERDQERRPSMRSA